MHRRCASLFAIAGLLASHLAAVPHAHAAASADEREQHDATPHVHCGWLGHSDHHHEHRHGHHGHSRHDDGLKNPSFVAFPGAASCTDACFKDHDADAVFLANASYSNFTVGRSTPSVPAWRIAAFIPVLVSQADFEPASLGLPPWRPPDGVLDGSQTYLTLRNLRI